MRTLAIDLGARRVGLALSDQGGRLATPLEVLQVRSADHASQCVAQAAQQHSVEQLVVGLPLNMDGSFGPAARDAAQWGAQLAQRCGLPVRFVDERLSSFAAEQSLIEQKRGGHKITRKQKKKRLDALAAADFLQAFLDGRLKPIESDEIESLHQRERDINAKAGGEANDQ